MLKILSTLAILIAAVTLNAQTVKPIYVVHVNLGNTQLSQNVIEEFLRSNAGFKNRPVILLRPNLDVLDNPFSSSKWSRQMGLTRQNNEIKYEYTPILNNKMTQWFEELERKDIHPEVFIINGHHLVGMGFESNNVWNTGVKDQDGDEISLARRSVYFETLVRSRDHIPTVKRFFDGIKLVFIGGCEGLANLEPKEKGLSGRALKPEEIKNKYMSNKKDLMLGDISTETGLAGYKADLVRVYGDEYTFNANEEICVDRENRIHCNKYDVNRILPDSGLWDGNHTFNLPLQMKKTFPNSLAVFGFATPSPVTPGPIWRAAFDEARNKLKMSNVFQPLLSEEVTVAQKKEIVQRLRISWTKATQQMNRRYRNGKVIYRISGSITPAFPDLDKNGLFAYDAGVKEFSEAPAFAPYEVREDNDSPSEQEDPLFHFIKKLENK